MEADYLASGFADVDAGRDAAAYTGCLSLLDALPYFRGVKELSYERLRLGPGLAVLDVGCGLGDDARRLAARVTPGGQVVGIGSSRGMIEQARTRTETPGCRFQVADARELPFADGSFDRARVDRVLQHIADSEPVVAEIARVLRPGGLLVAYDNDWGTFTVSSLDRAVTRTVLDYWCDSFRNGWIGRSLRGQLLAAGFADVTVEPATFVTDDFELADRVFDLRQSAARVVAAGLLRAEQVQTWVGDLQEQSRRGMFQATLTAVTVTGLGTAESRSARTSDSGRP